MQTFGNIIEINKVGVLHPIQHLIMFNMFIHLYKLAFSTDNLEQILSVIMKLQFIFLDAMTMCVNLFLNLAI